ncbi:Translational activator of cytochrome c oxidase 1 [Lamellibrachia satsuma]|nr:Translational activator of cytochrome c oxidase 1 [Lamellibrachia satsuma]
MAGHSKWANIRHIKASKDSEKQRVSSKIAQRIKVVVREGGSADPKYNFLLARLLEDAKAKDVPKTTIENALKGLAKTKDKGSVVYVQAKGVGNCLLMVETFTEKSQRTRQEVQHVMKKFGGTIGDSGLAQHSFHHKGCVYVPMENTEKKLTLDEAMDVAIETGAEEVEETHDDDGNRVLKMVSCIDHNMASCVDHNMVSCVDHNMASCVDHNMASCIDHNMASCVDHNMASCIDHNMASCVDHNMASCVDHNMVSCVDHNMVSCVDHNMVSCVDHNMASCVDHNMASCVDHNMASCVDHNMASCVDHNMVSCVDHNMASCVDHNMASCVDHNMASCVDHNMASCVDHNMVSCVGHNMVSCVDHNMTSCVDYNMASFG